MENIYKDLHSNQKIFIYEMLKRGIDVSIIDAEREIIKTSYNGHNELICDRDSSIMPYNVVDYSYTESMDVEDVEVVLYGMSEDYIAVACFTVNNKNYSIYTPLITGDIMRGIVTECIENNM